MDLGALVLCLAAVAFASLVIMVACDSFEEAADYLGRDFPPGIKGATINAIGSSLPELFTASILLFAYQDQDGFSAGIATCAGSAIFNAVLIPALCAFAVLTRGVRRADGSVERVQAITVSRHTILRDGIFFIAAEVLLIYFLRDSTMVWWMGASLMAVYAFYFAYLMRELRIGRVVADEDADEDAEANEDGESSFLTSLIRLEFNELFFGGRPLNAGRAWVVLSLATVTIGAACYLLAEAVVESAAIMSVPTYFTAVILAAAATSVPDTILSVKDALSGDYDDAVSNALGSNIFDITVALGLPLLVYGLVYGDIHLSSPLNDAANVQDLRIALVLVTGLVMAVFLFGGPIGRPKALGLVLIYVAWTGFIVWRATAPEPQVGDHATATQVYRQHQQASSATVRQVQFENYDKPVFTGISGRRATL